MTKDIRLQRHIIDRLLYLLEETSVVKASEADPNFAKYIEQLYEDLDQHASKLGHTVTV